jgi:hypothetical protein
MWDFTSNLKFTFQQTASREKEALKIARIKKERILEWQELQHQANDN